MDDSNNGMRRRYIISNVYIRSTRDFNLIPIAWPIAWSIPKICCFDNPPYNDDIPELIEL